MVCVDSASASVQIGSQQIVVTADGARATITRAPFRIAIQQGSGQSALSEVPNSSPLPQVQLPSVYPSLIGGAPEPGEPLYAPLSFLVGTASTTQWGGGSLFFQGDELAGLVAGIQYSARNVLSARADHAGVSLILSTNDPTGRKLRVTVAPGPDGTIQVTATASPSSGVAIISDSFASSPSEAFHGFGGRHNAINQHGNDFDSWIEEENSSGFPGGQSIEDAAAGQPNYMFPNGPEAAYTVQALFYSSRAYGFLLNQPQFARWRMDSDRSNAWQVDAYGARLDYVVAPGPLTRAIKSITAISGRERVPPAWAIGPEIDRAADGSKPQTPAQAEGEISSDLTTIRRDRLTVDAYRPETWTLLTQAQQHRFVTQLVHQRIRLMRYFRAFVASPSGGLEPDGDYAYAVAHHLVAMSANGSPAIFSSPFQNGHAALLDFTNPATVAWWRGRIDQALNQGADGFMQDFGEQVDSDWRFHDGQTGASMHNEYPILYDRTTRQIIDQYMARHRGRQIFFFTRAGYSGSPGSAAYENAEFLGDNTTTWDAASGIASVIPDMLNRSVGGAYGPDTDIGGYLNLLSPVTTPQLFDRWAELSALTPFYRVHNSGESGTEMPWALGTQTLEIYKAMARLHIDAEPLILKLWKQADKTGIPIMRPLWLSYPGEQTGALQDQEWLLGADVLVAPVVVESANARTVFFPQGCWRNPTTGITYHGPASATVSAPLAALPYYFRCGSRPFAR
jgi:alpha-glucosidase (family GH31 glycosyl hydrolase)